MSPAVHIRGLSVRYRPQDPLALADVDLTLEPGASLAVIGASGAGKTTLGRAALGLLAPFAQVSGRVEVSGIDMLRAADDERVRIRGRAIAMVFQSAAATFNPSRRVGAQVVEVVALDRPLTREAQRAFVGERLREVELEPECADAWPHQLSGGQLQRAALAMALATDPQVVVADEPVASLDVLRRAEIVRLLGQLKAHRQLGLLLITHDLTLASALCEDAVVMRQGRVVESGSMQTLLTAPTHAYTGALVEAARALRSDGSGGSGDRPTVGDLGPAGDQ